MWSTGAWKKIKIEHILSKPFFSGDIVLPFKFRPLPAIAAVTLMMASTAALPARAADNFTPAQKTELNAMMKDFLMENPQVILDAVNKFKEDEAKREEEKAKGALKELSKELYDSGSPFLGNPAAKTVLVEYFDYNCGYCKKAFEEITKLVAEDKDVKVILKDMPILSEQSLKASKWALAAHKQGKYAAFHGAMMKHNGPKTDDVLTKLAKDSGLDIEKLKKDAEGADIQKIIEQDVATAQKLSISGTPGFIIGDEIIRGYVPYEGLKELIKQMRDGKKAAP